MTELKRNQVLSFEEGLLTIKIAGHGTANGWATLSFREDQFELNADGHQVVEIAPSELRELRDFLNRVLPGVPQEAPQPIETAPKDGSHILAWRVPIGIRFTNNTNPPTVVHWFDDPEEPGFYTSVNELAPEHPFNPTHWMPLPAGPSLSRPHRGGSQ